MPGRIHVRGLRLATRSSSTEWTISADRAAIELDLRALRRRIVRIRTLRGDGVRSELRRRQGEVPPRPPRRPSSGKPPWTFELARIELEHVRQLRFAGLRLVGDGRLDGALRIVSGREVRLSPTRLRMAGAQLLRGTRVLVSGLDLDAEATLGPYAPRQHRGLAAWDFVDARLAARGRVDELPLLAKVTGPRPATPGALVAELRVARGRLTPGSRLRLTAPSATPRSRSPSPPPSSRIRCGCTSASKGAASPAVAAATAGRWCRSSRWRSTPRRRRSPCASSSRRCAPA